MAQQMRCRGFCCESKLHGLVFVHFLAFFLTLLSWMPLVVEPPKDVHLFALHSLSGCELDCGPIPRKLWFTYAHNILETKEPEHFYKNVLNTINAYASFWNSSTTTSFQSDHLITEVHFLNNTNCADLLNQIDPLLGEAFANESRGDFKGDLCRVAALYLYGGYYFDVDMKVIQPVDLPYHVSFSTSKAVGAPIFFNSFMASSSRHPILNATLRSFYEYYILRTGYCRNDTGGQDYKKMVGCCTLWDGYHATPKKERGETFIMQEVHLSDGFYPDLNSSGFHMCDFVVHYNASHRAYFYSRIFGSRNCH